MEFVEKTVISETPPQLTNVAWLQPSTKEIKYFVNGEWSTVYGMLPDTINGILEMLEEVIRNPSMLTFKEESLTWESEQVVTPEEIESILGITIAQAKALVNGEIPFIKISDSTHWYGLMFSATNDGTGYYTSIHSDLWGDVTANFTWDDQRGLIIQANQIIS